MMNLLFPESQMFLFPGALLINSWERVYRNALGPYMSENLFILPWKWKLLGGFQLFVTPGLYSPWNSPGQNTGMGSCSLLQEILLTQGSNPDLLHCRWILYCEPPGNTRGNLGIWGIATMICSASANVNLLSIRTRCHTSRFLVAY